MPITRTAWVDDDGSGTTGTVINNAVKTELYNQIDAAVAAGGLSSGNNYINDNANANMTVGLTINQGAADDQIVALKSSDVAHGMTARAETDTFAAMTKYSATQGGLRMDGFSSGETGFYFRGFITTGDVVKSTAASAAIMFEAGQKSGASTAPLDANENLLCVRSDNQTKFIFDADGDSHQDVGTAWTNFDAHDDVAVLQTLAAHVSRPDDPLRAGFGQWLDRAREPLERLGLVTFNADGHHFVNMSRLTMLLVGAVRQVGSRVEHLSDRLDRLERRLGAPEVSPHG